MSNLNSEQLIPATAGSGNNNGNFGGVFVGAGTGLMKAVLVDIDVRTGIEKTFKEPDGSVRKTVQDEVRFVFQTEDTITEEDIRQAAAQAGVEPSAKDLERAGQRFLVWSRWMAFKLSKSDAKKHTTLTTFLKDWRGSFIPDDEIPTHNLVQYLGKNAVIFVAQEAAANDSSKVYTNLKSIAPLDEKQQKKLGAPIEPKDYTRKKDRKKKTEDASAA